MDIAIIRSNHEQEVMPNGKHYCRVCGSGDGCDVDDVFTYADGLNRALRTARHALTTLHGLTAADGPSDPWTIDESKTLAEIDAALLLGELTPPGARVGRE